MKRIKLFGFNIWISREPLRVVHKDRKRNSYRSSQRNLRLEMTENRCEVCGKLPNTIEVIGTIHDNPDLLNGK